MSYKTLTYSKEASFLAPEEANIGVITLNRPDALNALSLDLLTELNTLLDDVQKDDKIRAVVVTGAGRAFSVGADLPVSFCSFLLASAKLVSSRSRLP